MGKVSDKITAIEAKITALETRLAAGTAPVEEAEFGSNKKRVKYSAAMRNADTKELRYWESQLSQLQTVFGSRALVVKSGF